ncbi:MAG: hypothetical protein LWX51_06165 [Deltaproteobacteria bacterium]|jgi:ribosomal protein L31|nr:hypothetical protein [Deltaproteobacteria bacterium]
MNNMKTIFLCLVFLTLLVGGVGYAGTYFDSAHGNSTHGVNRTSTTQYATGNCAHCHEQHASIDGAEPAPNSVSPDPGPDQVLLFSEEETVCEYCHDGNSAADNIQIQFDDKTYAHPTDDYSGVHKVSESTTADMDPGDYDPTNSLHAECVDCHNPHAAGSTVHTAETNTVTATSPLYKVSGVNPPSTAAWVTPAAASYTEKPTSTGISFEYELCYKCHSSWTGPNDPVVRDTAKEFNSANASYHSVEDTGKASAYGTYVNPWDKDSLMYCSDCHGSETSSDPAGPHGSTIAHILKGNYNRDTGKSGQSTSDHLCFDCHDYQTYKAGGTNSGGSGFAKSSGNLHTSTNHNAAVCMDCHSALPHGINRKHLIVLTTDNADYINSAKITSFTNVDDRDYVKLNCATIGIGCH